jgi:protein phosphatase
MSHATIYCPNPLCQHPNALDYKRCERCQTFLPKRYLWAVGLESSGYQRGEMLGDRYIFQEKQVLLDSKPSFPPDFDPTSPDIAFPYLALLAYRLQIPQPYGMLKLGEQNLLLLESSSIYPMGSIDQEGYQLEGQMMPLLQDLWSESTFLQQINYFYQIIQLWIGASALKVEGALIKSGNIYLGHGFIRLLELYEHPEESYTISDLGHFWLYRQGFREIPRFWDDLWNKMIQGQIGNGDEVLTILDHEIANQAQNLTVQVKIATLTDQGPSRSGNEDACHPKSGTSLTYDGDLSTWVIVCDGVGGQACGEVASHLAISQITEQLKVLNNSQYAPYKPYEIVDIVSNAILSANDAICERNDNEERKERDRMGTTTVLALLDKVNLYLAHIGDSRAYRITRSGCYQISVDDDIASRETRQGNGFYRDVSRYPAAGALTQALGINRSVWLRPTIQRFTVAEDCVFLLCSDGLSDFDRIEETWKQELVPVLDGTLDVSDACQRLVEVANTYNGHDNVTVSLIHYRITGSTVSDAKTIRVDAEPVKRRKQPPIAKPSQRPTRLPLLVLLGLLAALAFGIYKFRVAPNSVATNPLPSVQPTFTPLNVGQLLRLPDSKPGLVLRTTADQNATAPIDINAGTVVPGTLLKVVQRQERPGQEAWIKLQVCNAPPTHQIQPGTLGWQSEQILQDLEQPLGLTPAVMGDCAPVVSPSEIPTTLPATPVSP